MITNSPFLLSRLHTYIQKCFCMYIKQDRHTLVSVVFLSFSLEANSSLKASASSSDARSVYEELASSEKLRKLILRNARLIYVHELV